MKNPKTTAFININNTAFFSSLQIKTKTGNNINKVTKGPTNKQGILSCGKLVLKIIKVATIYKKNPDQHFALSMCLRTINNTLMHPIMLPTIRVNATPILILF